MKYIARVSFDFYMDVAIEADNKEDAEDALDEYLSDEAYSLYDLNLDYSDVMSLEEAEGNEADYADDEINASEFL